jgi:hypothetical protein
MTMDNAERILQGKSPFLKENVKLLYFVDLEETPYLTPSWRL